jgi:hypothetical protein
MDDAPIYLMRKLSCLRVACPAGHDVFVYNPSIWEAEAGRSQVQGQPELHSKTMSQKKKKKKKKETVKSGLSKIAQTLSSS